MNAQTIKAGMLGLAVGDALGVPAEFKSRQELDREPVQGMRSGGTHGQPAGTWSDDTSMALCLLESLTGGLDYQDMMTRFLRWAEDPGANGPGQSCPPRRRAGCNVPGPRRWPAAESRNLTTATAR